MSDKKRKIFIPRLCQIFFLAVACLCVVSPVNSEQLPLKTYTVADGLASNYVMQIYQDRHGFIWFATWEGLSRFDGYNFKNFYEIDGLSHNSISQITEDKDGNLWFATANGISRLRNKQREIVFPLNPDKQKFDAFKIKEGNDLQTMAVNQVNSLLFDSAGSLWCFSNGGVFRVKNPTLPKLEFETVSVDHPGASAYYDEADGTIWFGSKVDLMQIRGSEIINHGSVGGEFPINQINKIRKDLSGRLLVLDFHNLFEYLPADNVRSKGELKKLYEINSPLLTNSFLVDVENTLWIGKSDGMLKIQSDKQTQYTIDDGLPVPNVVNFFRDNAENLWISLYGGGVSRLLTESVVSFVPKYKSKVVGDVFESQNGEIWGSLFDNSVGVVKEGEFIISKSLDFPTKTNSSTWFLRNNDGSWRQAYHNGGTVTSNPRLQLKNGTILEIAKHFPTKKKSIRIYEDKQGIIWVGTDEKKIYRGKFNENGILNFETFPVDGIFDNFNSRIAGDETKGIWLSNWTFFGRLKDGIYSPIKITDGSDEINPNIRSMLIDSRGWLWLGHRYKGVSVTKEPAADNPIFTHFPKGKTPLSSNAVRSMVEDNEGKIYFGTDSGLDRFDPITNEWTKFSTKNGLAGNAVYSLIKDRFGLIWVGTEGGLSRIDSSLELKKPNSPPVYFTDIVIAGKRFDLPETGLAEVPKVELESSANNLTISFVAPNFQEENLSYQHKLGDSDWSNSSKDRTVSFSNLASGNYRFEVRVVNQNNLSGEKNAVFEFRILPPIYLRWWFVLGVLSLTGFAVYQLYLFRIRRLLEIERTRTRIATDLHDDIGTNLSKISLLSEIVKMQLADENEERSRMLQVIGETSRESVGAMSDIVWAINPKKDSLADMTRRMRQHAEEIFLEKGVTLKFNAPEDGKDLKLSMEVRRELYLIFKESVTNAAKHSDCKNVEIDFGIKQNELFLQIKDDGKGFNSIQDSNGNGLKNLRLRAERIGAKIEIKTEIGKGTIVSINLRQKF